MIAESSSRLLRSLSLPLSTLALVIFSGTSVSANQKTLTRDIEEVVVEGDDLPLFKETLERAAALSKPANKVEEAVRDLVPDEFTPREALEFLYRLRALADEDKGPAR